MSCSVQRFSTETVINNKTKSCVISCSCATLKCCKRGCCSFDISSLTQINKLGYVKKVLAHPELEGRLIYGTDWPLQFFPLISPWYHLDEISVSQAFAISRIKNQWDRDVALKIGMGLDREVFAVGNKLFASAAQR